MHPDREPNNGGLSTAEQASGIQYPGTDVYQCPGYPGPEKPMVTLPSGATIQTLPRFKQGNDGLRAVAAEKGAICLDAELLFLNAAATEGYDALFNAGQFNHPNTHGIDVSYGATYRALARTLTNTRIQATKVPAAATAAPPTELVIVKSADQVVNNSTTSAQDAELKITLAQSDVWVITGVLYYNSPVTADLKIWWTVPNGTLGANGAIGLAPSAPGIAGEATATASTGIAGGSQTVVGGAGVPLVAHINAYVYGAGPGPGPGPGDMILRWGQVNATASDTTIFKGSHLRARKIG